MALIPLKQIDFTEGVNLGTGSMIISGGLIVSGGVADFTNASAVLGNFGIFAQTGSFYATTNNLQITGSLVISGGAVHVQSLTSSGASLFTGAITHDAANSVLQFMYLDANNIEQFITPNMDGQILMYSQSAITASRWIDGGTY